MSAQLQPLSETGRCWVLQPEFSDEFDDDTLDVRKWDNHIASWGAWSWKPENVRTENGLLKVRMQYQEHERDGRKLYYTSGEIRSKASPITYGYFEARLKTAPLFPGVSPGFWLYRSEPDIWTEMDFELTQSTQVELVQPNCFVFRHPKLADVPVIRGTQMKVCDVYNWDAGWDPGQAFHVYGIEWDEDAITWYVDGARLRSRKNEFWDQPLDVIISFGLRHPYGEKPTPRGFPTEFAVDYIRVWKRG